MDYIRCSYFNLLRRIALLDIHTMKSIPSAEPIAAGTLANAGPVISLPAGLIKRGRKSVTPSVDESARILADMIIRQKPFFFVRYGDGAIECVFRQHGMTCDLEQYSPALGAALLDAWTTLCMFGNDRLYVGDWLSASFDSQSEYSRYSELYSALLGEDQPDLNFLHFEALLLMRESQELVDFYRAVKADPRKKLFMGPAGNAGAARMLGAEFLETPMSNLFAYVDALTDELLKRDFDVLLYGAGMAGNIPAARCFEEHPERTYVALGSAMDPLFRGRSRRQQLLSGRARMLFRELL